MRLIKVVVVVGAGFAVYLVGAYWWYSTPPHRPKSVPRTAAYYAGLAIPFGIGQHGAWINCWLDVAQKVDRCRNTSVDGSILYEGIYAPYQKRMPVPESELLIDSTVMNQAQEEFELSATSQESATPGLVFVSLIYLRNGEILIPDKVYREATKRLDDLRQTHSP